LDPAAAAQSYPYPTYILASPSFFSPGNFTAIYGVDAAGALQAVVSSTERLDATLELGFSPDGQQLYGLNYNKSTGRNRLVLIAPNGEVTFAPLDLGSQVRVMTIPLDGKIRLLRNSQLNTELLTVDPRAGYALTSVVIGAGGWAARDMTHDRAGNLYFSGGPVSSIGVYRIAPDLTVTKVAQAQPGAPALFDPFGVHCDLGTNTLWIADNIPSSQGRVFSLKLNSNELNFYATVKNFTQPSLRCINFDSETQLPILGLHQTGLVGSLVPAGTLQAPLSIKSSVDIKLRPN
jgi:hypothetical protein